MESVGAGRACFSAEWFFFGSESTGFLKKPLSSIRKVRLPSQGEASNLEDRNLEQGVVSLYSEDKGFGFIRREDGKQVLVERSSLDWPGFKSLNPGDHVRFDVRETARGLRAENVKRE
jgi:CspA family cold shock protein